ncbi:glycosyltransferase family 2 protein [Niallia sp. SS-2023]|uniref:glycosyltransferase family 2 protein n=1 Tax=Niallia sp. SS-2023 TaxID=3051155 RepID=UPI002549CC26|nr:glycosyltransferase family 2 protein [Niallia sp. SS-2023]MDL0437787.1 glycosyltransferase family 2 protein [Niallia sp. SS-2023]
MKISLALIVKNEENSVKKCILNAKKIVDEIVVVDTGSTDSTLKILKENSNLKLFEFLWENDFSKARNYAIDQCTGDYILVLDADEYITFGKRNELEKVMKQNQIGRIKIVSKFKKDGEEFEASSYISRFFPNSVRYKGAIHEQLDSTLQRVDMKLTVSHSGYFDKDKSARNIPILLQELEKHPKDAYFHYQLGKEYRLSKSFNKSWDHLQKAYELVKQHDAFYDQLILELLQTGKELVNKETIIVIRENEQSLNNVTDFHFYKGLFYLDYCLNNLNEAIHLLPKIEASFTACLNISKKKHTEYLSGTGSFLALYNLGVYHESIGSIVKAKRYYMESARLGYEPAKIRLAAI